MTESNSTKLSLSKPELVTEKTVGQKLSELTGAAIVQEDKDQVTLQGDGKLVSIMLGDGYAEAAQRAIHNFGTAV